MSTLSDALAQVNNLSSVSFVQDDEPDISPASLSIGTRACADTNLADVARHASDEESHEEARIVGEIVSVCVCVCVYVCVHFNAHTLTSLTLSLAPHTLPQAKQVKEGYDYANLLYAARSYSKAIPQVKSPDQPNRMQLYEETMKVRERVCVCACVCVCV